MKYAILLLCFVSAVLVAQTSELDSIKHLPEVTIVGEKARTIPGSGQYISAKKLAILNQPNVNNVLRTIPGVNVRDEEGFGLRPNIGMRGTSVNRSTKVTLMEDGILIAPATYADPSAYYFPTFARMQAVEVLKGSSQIKYGPYTVGGAVNLISTPIPDSFKGHAKASYGSFGTNQQRIWLGNSTNHLDYVIEVNRLASNGFKELDNQGNTGFDRRDVMGKLRWHTSENAVIPQSLTLKLVHAQEKGNESYLGLTYDDYIQNPLRRYAATQKDLLDLSHNHASLVHAITPANNLSIKTVGYFSQTFRDWARVNTIGGKSLNTILGNPLANQEAYQIMVGEANGPIDFQSAARNFYSSGIQTTAQYTFGRNGLYHNIQLGLRYHRDQADRYATRSSFDMINGTMMLNNAGTRGNQENQIRKAQSIAGFVHYDISFKGLKVSPGIRFENIGFDIENYGNADEERFGTSLKTASNDINIALPGIGVKYDFNATSNVFLGVHKGFSPPGMPSLTSPNAQAKAETAINYELGYRYENRNFNAQIVGFVSDYENILGSDNVSGGGAGSGDLFNAGNALIQGLEVNFEANLLNGHIEDKGLRLPLTITYTFTDARFKENFINAGGDWGSGQINRNDMIPFVTPHLFSAGLGFENNKFSVNMISRYVGETRTKPGQTKTTTPAAGIAYNDVNAISGFMLLDLSANYRFYRFLTAFSTIGNITNNTSIAANLPNGYRPNMPFNINLGLKADF